MLEQIEKSKETYKLKIIAVSIEARELNEYRIHKFQLNKFVDFYISSCYVHLRKPDTAIFKLAFGGIQMPTDK